MNELAEKEPWLSSSKLVVKPDMLFGKRGKSGLVALNLDFAQVAIFVKERLGKEVIDSLICFICVDKLFLCLVQLVDFNCWNLYLPSFFFYIF